MATLKSLLEKLSGFRYYCDININKIAARIMQASTTYDIRIRNLLLFPPSTLYSVFIVMTLSRYQRLRKYQVKLKVLKFITKYGNFNMFGRDNSKQHSDIICNCTAILENQLLLSKFGVKTSRNLHIYTMRPMTWRNKV